MIDGGQLTNEKVGKCGSKRTKVNLGRCNQSIFSVLNITCNTGIIILLLIIIVNIILIRGCLNICLHAVFSNCLYLGTISHHSGGNIKGFSCFIFYFQHPGHQNDLPCLENAQKHDVCLFPVFEFSPNRVIWSMCLKWKINSFRNWHSQVFFWKFHVSSHHCNVLNGFPSCVNIFRGFGFLMKYHDGSFHLWVPSLVLL